MEEPHLPFSIVEVFDTSTKFEDEKEPDPMISLLTAFGPQPGVRDPLLDAFRPQPGSFFMIEDFPQPGKRSEFIGFDDSLSSASKTSMSIATTT